MKIFDLFVIGAGSGGVRAARIAASHGARVAIAEEYRVGGTCVIRGCVPKKLLVYGAHFADELGAAANYGWNIAGAKTGTETAGAVARFDWTYLRDRIQGEVARLEGLYKQTLATNDVTLFAERAVIAAPQIVELASGERVRAKVILIATGGTPTRPTIIGADLALTSNEIFHIERLPTRMMIIGGGYIAHEFASILHSFGVQVMLATHGERMLRGYDSEAVGHLLDMERAKGIDVRFHVALESIARQADGSLRMTVAATKDADADAGGQPVTIDSDMLLFATGRRPNSSGLGLEAMGIECTENGAICVDVMNQTNIPDIYAIGDVTNRLQLTPVAIREGQAFADRCFGGVERWVDYEAVPTAVFASPPLASVGLSEEAAQARYGAAEVRVYRSSFRPMQAILAGHANLRCFYKMVTVGEPSGAVGSASGVAGRTGAAGGAEEVVVGLHMVGPESAEIIQAAAVAVKAGLSKQAFDDVVALHPTMAEELVLLR